MIPGGQGVIVIDIKRDVVFAARVLRRQRLPALVAVLCLALGIGATTTMFSVGSTLLTTPLPFAHGERLVQIFSANGTALREPPNSYQDMLDWRRRTHVFDAMGGIGSWDFIVRSSGEAQQVPGGLATAGFFETLGAAPERGRFFTDEDDTPGSARVAIVSHGLAERMLGGASDAVGKVVNLTGQSVTIVGVLADRWRFPSRAEIWVPVARLNGLARRGTRNMTVVAALRPGVTLDAARRDLAAVGAQLATEYPGTNAGIQPGLVPLREHYVGQERLPMELLTIGSLLVLLVACANAAGLQLARSTQQTREIAMRAALGAGRGRLMREMLIESGLLSLLAAVLGVALAVWGTAVVSSAVAAGAPSWLRFGLDGRALAFTVVVALAAGVGFGAVPALRSSSVDPADALRGGERAVGVRHSRLQRLFVGAEVALSLMLLVSSGLALLGVYRLQHVPLGFDPDGVLTFRVLLEGPQYDASSRRVLATNDLVRRLDALPGVESAAAVGIAPVMDCCSRFGLTVEGQPVEPGREPLIVGNTITPGFFHTMRIPVLRGRDFMSDEGSDSAPVVIVNQAFARHYWPGADPIGRRIKAGSGAWAPVVGVVADSRQSEIGDVAEPEIFLPYTQQRWSGISFVVRATAGDAGALMPAIRRAVREMDPGVPVSGEQTMASGIEQQIASPRAVGSMITGFAVVALLLAIAGVYAIMAFYVSQRTRELGVRLALGASPRGLQAMVLREGTVLASAGAVVGLFGSWAGSRVLAGAFYGVSAFEPLLYVGLAALLVGAAVLASWVPAHRASRVHPMEALRAD